MIAPIKLHDTKLGSTSLLPNNIENSVKMSFCPRKWRFERVHQLHLLLTLYKYNTHAAVYKERKKVINRLAVNCQKEQNTRI